MTEKRLEEIMVSVDNARKRKAEELKSIREQQERIKRLLLIMETLKELLEENTDFRKQFECKLAELSHKEKGAMQRKP